MLSIDRIHVKDQRVLIRSDLNVPLTELGEISDDTRIQASLPIIADCLKQGALTMVTSHLGRPKAGQWDAALSLAPVAKRMQELLGVPVVLSDWSAPRPQIGQVLLLENCRFNEGEKNNDETWSRKIASYCDIFVMDAFGSAHRAEATTEGIAHFAKTACAGPLLIGEVTALEQALSQPKLPLLAMVGGSKVSTKLTVLEHLATKVACLIVGGGIANTLLLASGYQVGTSLVEQDQLETARQLLSLCEKQDVKVLLPTDVVCAKHFSAQATPILKSVNTLDNDDMILDFGGQSMIAICDEIAKANTIIWNGPVGVFEFPSFSQGTKQLAAAMANTSAFTLAGGGDTITAINQYHIAEKIDYISTGGGAFLEYLSGQKLPGVEVLRSRA